MKRCELAAALLDEIDRTRTQLTQLRKGRSHTNGGEKEGGRAMRGVSTPLAGVPESDD